MGDGNSGHVPLYIVKRMSPFSNKMSELVVTRVSTLLTTGAKVLLDRPHLMQWLCFTSVINLLAVLISILLFGAKNTFPISSLIIKTI